MAQAVTPPPAGPTAQKSAAGLEGIVAAKSAICFIDGVAGRLVYRGYEIGDLVEHSSFEEVAHLLWEGKLPNRTELDRLRKDLSASAKLPEYAITVLRELPPKSPPIDV